MRKRILAFVVVLLSAVSMMGTVTGAGLNRNAGSLPNAVALPDAVVHKSEVQIPQAAVRIDSRVRDMSRFVIVGYRGTFGWKFPNFGTPLIGWKLFRDYFNPGAVEYVDGTHRPSAQAWYDCAYKGVGGGGDCFGMSLRSIRTRLKEWNGLYKSWWPSHLQPTVWDYDNSNSEVVDSVREDQAGQLCAQNAALINDRWNHQSHNQAYDFIKAALATADPHQQPVLCMWRDFTAGHAIVAYKTKDSGDDHRIMVYDNNKPYAVAEASDGNSLAHVYNASNTFAYDYSPGFTANKMIAFRFSELTPSTPLLPASAGGPSTGLTAGCTVVVSESPTAIKQITDQAGHTFFSGSQENANAATRIPDSMRFVPLMGADMPADYPAIFIFNNSDGRSLTFNIAQDTPAAIRFFSPGRVTSLKLRTGTVQITNLLHQDQELILANPSAMSVSDVSLISVQTDDSERLFEVKDLSGVKQDRLGIQLSTGARGIIFVGGKGSPAKLNMNIRNYSGNGMQQTAMTNLSIGANQRGVISIQDFNKLQNIAPRFEIR